MKLRFFFILMSIAAAVMSLRAQGAAPKPSFEVASVKPFSDGAPNFAGFQSQPGGRFTVAGVTLQMLMNYAYRLQTFQIVGGPDWLTSDRWEVVAKAEEGSVPGRPVRNFNPTVPDPIGLMLQWLLEDRFQLKTHRETKELSTYDLVVAKGGAKVQLSNDQSPADPTDRLQASAARGELNIAASPSGSRLQGNAVPLSYLAGALSLQLARTVIDKTDLKSGLYDFKLQWMQGPSEGVALRPGESSATENSAGPSIFTAVQEQLGLRLVSSNGPVEVLVIDSVQKPKLN